MNDGSIQNPQAFLKAAILKGLEEFAQCFPRGIRFGDVDGMVEINNHFLFIECKSGNQEIPRGQWMSLVRLARQPRTSVWILWRDQETKRITHAQNMRVDATGMPSRRVSVTNELVIERMKAWAERVQKAPAND